MEKYAVIIIGAGASGMMCALNTNQKTLLIEAGDRVGKKILVTGNGKCNLTNNQILTRCYNTPLVEKYFRQFNQLQTVEYFQNLGIFTYADLAGRRYPLSNSARNVLDLLTKALSLKSNVTMLLNTVPKKIVKTASGFMVTTDNQSYQCEKLVLATGGNSGTQYLDQLKLPYQKFVPSLMGLKTKKNHGLDGVRVSNVRVRCREFDEVGEVLFKEDGISGIVIFNLSAYLARQKITTGTITLDLLANVPAHDLAMMLKNTLQKHPQYTVAEILAGFVQRNLARNLADRLGMFDRLAKDCTEQDQVALVKLLKHMPVIFHGYADNNQVHTGGVNLTDLDEHLQHRNLKHFYCVGEVVNVDGICGGFNLQWAWTSGKIVGDHL